MFDPDWPVVDCPEIESDLLRRLLRNEIAAIRVQNFLPPELCGRLAGAIEDHGFDYYENFDPPMGRIGITQYEHAGNRAEYFARAVEATERRKKIFTGMADPFETVIDAIRAAWGQEVSIAREPDLGADYFAGLIRLIAAGALVHCDWAPRDAAGWGIDDITGQLAWNVYLSSGEGGGRSIVYRRSWTPEVDEFVAEGTYGYLPASVQGYEREPIEPLVGQLLMFNARNLHSVEALVGRGSRITVSSFVGNKPDGSLVFWS